MSLVVFHNVLEYVGLVFRCWSFMEHEEKQKKERNQLKLVQKKNINLSIQI